MMKHKRFISILSTGSVYGCYGVGKNLRESLQNLRKEVPTGHRKEIETKAKSILFLSEFPFAPSDREANPDESDAYIDQSGAVCTLRCETIWLD